MVSRVRPCGPLRGTVRVPGDKSLAHRALILCALAEGASRLSHMPDSADVRATRRCLQLMGVPIACREETVNISGVGLRGLRPPRGPLDAGNSGTTARLLLGLLAAQGFAARLSGDASLRRRPMGRVAEPLRRMGARISLRGGERLPALVEGADLRPLRFVSPAPSAQLKSAVLIAGLFARGRTSVTEPLPSRDHTERLLAFYGAKLARRGLTAWVQGPARLQAVNWRLPGDPSSAAFWIVAATLIPGSRLRLAGVGANPRRLGFVQVLRRMGARIDCSAAKGSPEPICDIVSRPSGLRATKTAAARAPGLIDELPLLALAAS